ncbi:MAG: hypothetical protein HN597_20450 [Desulfobacula sp.]|jgi:hypothetical protein|uniref:hypothetical protein n=1 Tax=Desulfobacula sp. TaxID=2593537 RepID=UPI0039B98A84|nr:hypothetical protein [Desulfobacula sp.]
MTFTDWFNKLKPKRTAYLLSELKPIFLQCWNAARPKKKETRSDKQRRYQWGVVYKLISDHTGYTQDEVHQEMGKKFLAYEKDGKTFVKSTTKLSTKNMEIYLESVRRFAAMELFIYIPLPNEPDNFYYEVKP